MTPAVEPGFKSTSGELVERIANGRLCPHDLDGWRSTLTVHCKRWVETRQAKIAGHHQTGRRRLARKELRSLLASARARILAVLWANKKASIGVAVDRLNADVRALSGPASMPVARPLQKPKRGRDGYRQVYDFRPIDRARQHLLRIGVTPFASLLPTQLGPLWPGAGGGLPMAREALRQALEIAPTGAVFVELDLADAYGSISEDWLRDNLPLTRADIETCLSRSIILPGVGDVRALREAYLEPDRRGLPKGSAVSGLFADMAIAEALRASIGALGGAPFVVYSDNIGIVFPDEAAAFACLPRFRDAFQACGSGRFRLTQRGPISIGAGFPFLGRRWSRPASTVVVEPQRGVLDNAGRILSRLEREPAFDGRAAAAATIGNWSDCTNAAELAAELQSYMPRSR